MKPILLVKMTEEMVSKVVQVIRSNEIRSGRFLNLFFLYFCSSTSASNNFGNVANLQDIFARQHSTNFSIVFTYPFFMVNVFSHFRYSAHTCN